MTTSEEMAEVFSAFAGAPAGVGMAWGTVTGVRDGSHASVAMGDSPAPADCAALCRPVRGARGLAAILPNGQAVLLGQAGGQATEKAAVRMAAPWTGSAAVRRCGNVCVLSISAIHATEAVALGQNFNSNLIGTIPEGFRPSAVAYGEVGGNSSSMKAMLYVDNTSGNVYLAKPTVSTAPTSLGFYGSMTWVQE